MSWPRVQAVVWVALAVPLAGQAGSCGRFPEPGFDGADQPRVEGRYANRDYGYAVKVPAGLVGRMSPAPAPNHGFGIVLSWTPRAYLYADGSYEALEGDTLEQRAARFVRADAQRVLSSKSTRTKLGSLEAVRYVARYECPGLQGVYVTEEVMALSPDGGIIYTVALLTTDKRHRKDRLALQRMVHSFELKGRP